MAKGPPHSPKNPAAGPANFASRLDSLVGCSRGLGSAHLPDIMTLSII
jgi:hypothetical protein